MRSEAAGVEVAADACQNRASKRQWHMLHAAPTEQQQDIMLQPSPQETVPAAVLTHAWQCAEVGAGYGSYTTTPAPTGLSQQLRNIGAMAPSQCNELGWDSLWEAVAPTPKHAAMTAAEAARQLKQALLEQVTDLQHRGSLPNSWRSPRVTQGCHQWLGSQPQPLTVAGTRLGPPFVSPLPTPQQPTAAVRHFSPAGVALWSFPPALDTAPAPCRLQCCVLPELVPITALPPAHKQQQQQQVQPQYRVGWKAARGLRATPELHRESQPGSGAFASNSAEATCTALRQQPSQEQSVSSCQFIDPAGHHLLLSPFTSSALVQPVQARVTLRATAGPAVGNTHDLICAGPAWVPVEAIGRSPVPPGPVTLASLLPTSLAVASNLPPTKVKGALDSSGAMLQEDTVNHGSTAPDLPVHNPGRELCSGTCEPRGLTEQQPDCAHTSGNTDTQLPAAPEAEQAQHAEQRAKRRRQLLHSMTPAQVQERLDRLTPQQRAAVKERCERAKRREQQAGE